MLLRCEALRIDLAGSLLVDDLSFEVDGERVALVGDFRALFEVLGGRAHVVEGRFEVLGEEAARSVSQGLVGLVLGEARGAPRWTALDSLMKSALLLGLPPATARAQVSRVIERLGISPLVGRRIQFLSRVEHTALQLADALLSHPRVLFLRTPLAGLVATELAWLWSLIEIAATDRRLVVSFDNPMLDQLALVAAFDRVVVSHRGRVTAVGPPAQLLAPQSYLVSVTRGGEALADRLRAQACQVHLSGADDTQPAQLLVTGGAERISDFVAQAVSEGVCVVIEMVPLAGPMPDPAPSVGTEPH